MHLFTSLALLLLLHLKPALSSDFTQSQYCVASVYEAYVDVLFEGIGYGEYWVSTCQNPLKVTSIYASSKVFCSPEEITSGIKLLSTYCEAYGFVELLPMSEVAANLTTTAIAAMGIITQADVESGINMTNPVVIARDFYDVSYETLITWDYEMYTHTIYGYASYGFWGVVLVAGMLNRLVQLITESRSHASSADPENNTVVAYRSSSAVANILCPVTFSIAYLHKHMIVPSAFGSYHRVPLMWCTIPTRMESFLVYSFWLISIILGCVNYRAFQGNVYWADISPQVWRYIADRTGIMSYCNLCLIWAMGGRNNIFIWLTGWQFSTFNMFHRHIARVATLQAIMHSIAYTALYFVEGEGDDYYEEYQEPWFYLGVVATCCMSLIVFFSFMWFRAKGYEVFLLIHIVLSVAVIVTLFYHTSIFDGEYDVYLWPLVAIWSFDRFMRLARCAVCNLSVRFGSGGKIQTTKTVIVYDQESGIIRIELSTGAILVKQKPGQHYYLYQPFRLKGWENHPFTLAYWDASCLNSSTAQAPQDPKDVSTVTTVLERASASSSNDALESESVSERSQTQEAASTRLVFWVRPGNGWTRSLRNQCKKSANNTINTTILLEGPYGHAEPLWKFNKVLMIAGGSGIAAIVPYLLDHDQRAGHVAQAAGMAQKRRTDTRLMSLVWVNKSASFLNQVVERELVGPVSHGDVTVDLYATGSSTTEVVSKGKEMDSIGLSATEKAPVTPSSVPSHAISTTVGRPDITHIINQAASDALETNESLAIMVCGPGSLADTARAATHRVMKTGGVSIEYFEEAFGW